MWYYWSIPKLQRHNPLPNFWVWEWISNFIPNFIMDVIIITMPRLKLNQGHVYTTRMPTTDTFTYIYVCRNAKFESLALSRKWCSIMDPSCLKTPSNPSCQVPLMIVVKLNTTLWYQFLNTLSLSAPDGSSVRMLSFQCICSFTYWYFI